MSSRVLRGLVPFLPWVLVVGLTGCSEELFDQPTDDGGLKDGVVKWDGVVPGDSKKDLGKSPPNPYDPNNAKKDTDCDGLSDEEEYATIYPGGKQTDPAKPDSDGDGILDGVECGKTKSVDPTCKFTGDADPSTKTIPTQVDSDADKRNDGVEDANHDGKFDSSETDPLSPDTDGDGLDDGSEGLVVNGKVAANETDPRKKDTDGDKINDGVEKTVTKTDPTKADTDGDTCKDGAEDLNQNGKVDTGETDPNNATDCGTAQKDTDLDKIPDKIEDVNGNGAYDASLNETDLNNPDTDGDGLKDGVEDANYDGQVGAGETNPRRVDTDCDGLIDGPDKGSTLGEDQNANGTVDTGETDPTKADTDGDGLYDGLERKVTVNPDPTNCTTFKADADPTTGTNPTKLDTDGDGIADGSEDSNQNGKVDTGELDPNNPADGTGPVAKVCTTANLVTVLFKQESEPDIELALPTTFTQVTAMKTGGKTVGLMGYDSTRKVAFLVYRAAASSGATTPTADETALRTKVQAVGALSNITTQTFTTWDSYPALVAKYEQAGAVDLVARANALAVGLQGTGAGVLTGTAGAVGPFSLQAEVVHRSNNSVVVLLALTTKALFVEPAIFTIADTAGGSALAQFGDTTSVQCEKFTVGSGTVDFVFVVDNSGSMSNDQAALASTGTAMVASLNNSSLDWRIGMVTTTYSHTSGTGSGVFRGFTRTIAEFQGWLTSGNYCSGGFCSQSSGAISCTSQNDCWVTTSGSGTERCLQAAAKAVHDITPGTTTEVKTKARASANLVIIILGDADDQSSYTAAQYSTFFNTANGTVGAYQNKSGGKIPVHGIICPAGQTCGETQNNPQKHGAVITATGGVRGEIITTSTIATTMDQIVQSTIAASGYKTIKPPIGASIKIALDSVKSSTNCTKDNVPRSRLNGFDFDGMNQTISLFGDCRPGTTSTQAAVSYRYWINATPNPDYNKVPCQYDPFFDLTEVDYCKGKLVCNLTTDVCECPANCGATPPSSAWVCDTNKYVCAYVCTSDCGGTCTGYKTCDQTTCACVCPSTATCPTGYLFDTTSCTCICNTSALNCGTGYQADPTSCSCVCKPDCGGCPSGKNCVVSVCQCKGVA